METELEKWKAEVAKKSSTCSCENLAELYEKRKIAESLDELCDFLQANVDVENPKPEDMEFLQDCMKAQADFNKAVSAYHTCLNECIKDGKVISLYAFYRHDKGDYLEIAACAKCHQQIDILVKKEIS